jgi:hypothetical protein
MWYYERQNSDWWVGVSLALLFGHFVVPFLWLISRYPKRKKAVLVGGALWLVAMHWLDLYYVVGPVTHHFHGEYVKIPPVHVAQFTLLLGLGGLFVWAVARQMRGVALIPQRDPRLHESLTFENI